MAPPVHPVTGLIIQIPSTNVKFSDIQSSYNFINTDTAFANPINISEFRDKSLTDGSRVPRSPDAISLNSIKGKAFGSTWASKESEANAGISGPDPVANGKRGTFPISSGETFLFVFSKNASDSSVPEEVILTFSNSINTGIQVNACDDRSSWDPTWDPDTAPAPSNLLYNFSETAASDGNHKQFYSTNVSNHGTYTYFKVNFTTDTICNYYLKSELNYDKLYIFNMA